VRGPSLVVLTYHRVLPDGHPDREHEQPSMYVRPQTLAMHLRVLRQHFEFVHLDDWVEGRERGSDLPRLACAITFDDGWRDNYQFAFPILRQAGAPATIFLVSGMIGGEYSFWPNRLARQLTRSDRPLRLEDLPSPLRDCLCAAGLAQGARTSSFDPITIDRAIVACKAFSDADMHAYLDQLPALPQGNVARDLLDAGEIREMAASGLVRFGSHTRHHTRLRAGVHREVISDEVAGSADEIEKLTGSRPTLFCYPQGEFTPESLDVVRDHYRGAAVTRGWNESNLDPLLIRRVGMHEDVSARREEFLARLWMAR
jgi:peptidoglycan/xylan/chitin deacetylase (PgdA/CDA1 family)